MTVAVVDIDFLTPLHIPLCLLICQPGVIEDMQAYDAWLADEQTLRDMQRREEVNINHSHRHDEQDDVEIGGNF